MIKSERYINSVRNDILKALLMLVISIFLFSIIYFNKVEPLLHLIFLTFASILGFIGSFLFILSFADYFSFSKKDRNFARIARNQIY